MAFERARRRAVLAVAASVCYALLVYQLLARWDAREAALVPLALKFVPVLPSLAIWSVFRSSLRPGATPIAERFARRRHALIPDAVRLYCRRVTQAWCVLLSCNAAAAAALALWAPNAWWALYTGFLSYLLIGAMLLGERFITRPVLE